MDAKSISFRTQIILSVLHPSNAHSLNSLIGGIRARRCIRQHPEAQGRSASSLVRLGQFDCNGYELTPNSQPCCVCKEEKSKRDECMLFSKASDRAADCRSFVEQYKSCMLGFGYKV
ncbi:Cytochrome c oxidase copper chaperone, partial [Metarhizium majus ARSEF 297]